MLFPETAKVEWKVSRTDASTGGGHCFIDLTHNSAALDFRVVDAKKRPDVFGPFIRITNSYNGLRALTFNVGFFRKVCQNGLILPETVIKFKFHQLRRDIKDTIQFDLSRERLEKLKDEFSSYIDALRTCPVDSDEFEPFVRAVLGISKPKSLKPESIAASDWQELTKHISALGECYAQELGSNAYAVLNAVTDLASNPPPNRYVRRERHSLQKMAGTWLSKFAQQCQEPGFSLSKYLIQRL